MKNVGNFHKSIYGLEDDDCMDLDSGKFQQQKTEVMKNSIGVTHFNPGSRRNT